MTFDELSKLIPPINSDIFPMYPVLDTTTGSREKRGFISIAPLQLCGACNGLQIQPGGENNCAACKGTGQSFQKFSNSDILFQPDNAAHAYILGHLFLAEAHRVQGIRLSDQHKDILEGLRVISRWTTFIEAPMIGWDDDPFDLARH